MLHRYVIGFILCMLIFSTTSLTATAQTLEIWEIQGSGNVSPYLGQLVSTENNVVTAVGDDFFFIQTPSERSDNNAETSDGLFVYTGFFPNLQVGDLVHVSSVVSEFVGLTELAGFSLTFNATGEQAPLPAPVELTDEFPASAPATVRDLERVEGMRVHFDARVVEGSGSNEIAALAIGPDRPFREAGIPYPGQNGLPVWDNNPEIFWIDPNALNAPNNRFLSYGMSIDATGVLYQDDDLYIAFPSNYTVSGEVAETNLRLPTNQEFTVGSLNVLQLQSDEDDLDLKLDKLSRYIVNRLGSPDILALQEVGDLNALQELAFAIEQLDSSVDYIPYMLTGGSFINVAYLVRPTIQNVNVSQLGNQDLLSLGGRLHDRPPLLLEANLPTSPPTPISVLNLHLRSLLGITGSNSDFVRTKRYEQSLSVAQMVQDRQDNNLVILGDFNAFTQSDGYVDVVNQISGMPSLGAEYPVQPIVEPPLIDQVLSLEPEERYSYVFNGSANQLDHCLTTELAGLTVTEFAFARGNAGIATAYAGNPTIATRSSDHEGFVLYLDPTAPVGTAAITREESIQLQFPNPFQIQQDRIRIQPVGNGTVALWSTTGQLIWRITITDEEIALPQMVTGLYVLEVLTNGQRKVEKLMLIN